MRTFHRQLPALFVVLSLGCAMPAQDAPDPAGANGDPAAPASSAEGTGTVQQALDYTKVIGPHYWYQGMGAVALQPSATHFCALTGVAGSFQGGGESVHVYDDGALWWLTGTSSQAGVHGEAHCYAKSAFYRRQRIRMPGAPPAPTVERWTSGEFGASVTNGGNGYASAWWGDAFTFLTGVSGNLRGGAEGVQVLQSTDPYAPSTLQAYAGWPNLVWGTAVSFFVGVPGSGSSVNYYGPETTLTTTDVNQYGVQPGAFMMPTSQGVCYLTKISGDFVGGAESVRVFAQKDPWGVEQWRLVVTGGWYGTTKNGGFSGHQWVRGSARCVTFEQY